MQFLVAQLKFCTIEVLMETPRQNSLSKLQLFQVQDGDELTRLQELHDDVYEQARVWFQNLKIRFRNQILQHFGPMPEREADIQVNTVR